MKTKRSVYVLVPALGGILLALVILILSASFSPTLAKQLPENASQISIRDNDLSTSSVITIGIAADLSGDVSSLGWQVANSVQLAISQTNAAGGIYIGGITYTLALVTADSPCGDNGQAVIAANTLLNAGAKAVVGHTCSGTSIAAEPIYNAAGVAMISASSTDPQVTQQGYDTTFRTVTHDGIPPTLLATYFRNWLGFTRCAIVETPDTPWGSEMGDIFSNIFTSLGGTITSRRLSTSPSDFSIILNAIKTENPDGIVYLDGDPAEGGQFSFTAYGLGMTNVVIGWVSWSNDVTLLTTYATTAGTLVADNDYAAMEFRRFQDMPGWTGFLAAYQAADFSNQPNDPGFFGASAYDAARIIVTAMVSAESTDPAAIRNQVAATRNYKGVVGTYQGFDTNGDVIPQWAWLERNNTGQWVILQPTKLYLPAILNTFGP
jgi:branched-chain amino acid transport system substrate-binding protein